jgi:hypothetical protein
MIEEVDKEAFSSHLLGLSIVNSFMLLICRGSKLSNRHFRLMLVRDLIERGRRCLNHRHPHKEDKPIHSAN